MSADREPTGESEGSPEAHDHVRAPWRGHAHGSAIGDIPAQVIGQQSANLSEAARRSSLGRGLSGEESLRDSLVASIGGVRGVVEVLLPGILFVAVYAFTQDLVVALIAPVAVSLVFLAVRLVRREAINQVIGGLLATGVSAALALWSGRDEDFYLVGLWTNAAYGGAILLTVLVGWPLVGIIAGFVTEEGAAWRKDRRRRRVYSWLTLVLVAMFAARIAVQLPLYLAGEVEALGIARLAMGLPLFAPVLMLIWFVARAVTTVRDDGEARTEQA